MEKHTVSKIRYDYDWGYIEVIKTESGISVRKVSNGFDGDIVIIPVASNKIIIK